MCKTAGISGFRTNHSLRATTATRLYSAGIDEQLTMEQMGHRSVDGVRSYKRTADHLTEDVSNTLNRCKKRHLPPTPVPSTSLLAPIPVRSHVDVPYTSPPQLRSPPPSSACSTLTYPYPAVVSYPNLHANPTPYTYPNPHSLYHTHSVSSVSTTHNTQL